MQECRGKYLVGNEMKQRETCGSSDASVKRNKDRNKRVGRIGGKGKMEEAEKKAQKEREGLAIAIPRERRDEEEELQIMAGGAVFHHRHSQRASPSPPTSPNSHCMKGLLASFRVWVTLLDLIRYAVGFPFRLHACA